MEQAEVIQKQENEHVPGVEEGEARQNIRGLNLAVVKLTTVLVTIIIIIIIIIYLFI
jgi:hypothetical protein